MNFTEKQGQLVSLVKQEKYVCWNWNYKFLHSKCIYFSILFL